MSKNEKGVPKYELVLKREATVTRRRNPITVGSIRSVQSGRGKKGMGFIKIKSCELHSLWAINVCDHELQEEAKREGFESWGGLLKWFDEHKIDINNTFRIEFMLVD